MIVNDQPSVVDFFENQAEVALQIFVFLSLQIPVPEHEGNTRAKQADLEIGEGERAHFFRRRILFLVTVHGRLPAASRRAARAER